MNKLLNLSISILLFMTAGSQLMAQKVNQKMGKPSEEEWALTQCDVDPNAEAVVLFKSMTVTYKLAHSFNSYQGSYESLSTSNVSQLGTNNVNFAGTNVEYDCRLRTKVLKDSGKDYANVDLVYYTYNAGAVKECDYIEGLKVTVFSKNEKGKVVKRNINRSTFKIDNVGDYYCVMHIVVPDVKAGDIIEYHYGITSARAAYLYDWSFQENIPVLYSKCDMDIPSMLSFNVNVPINENVKSKVDKGSVRVESTSIDMQAAKTYPTNHYIIEATNMAPKGLEIQQTDAAGAGVKTSRGTVNNLASTIKNSNVTRPVEMPQGKSHLMIKP